MRTETKLATVPLSLTLIRLVLTPIFSILYLYYEALGLSIKQLPYLLIALVAISELSDLFDGILARRHNQVTALGKLLDPMADSIFRLSVFFTMTQGLIGLPLPLVLIFFVRDSLISTLRTLCALKGVALAARLSGKVKAVVQALAAMLILALMIPYSLDLLSLDSLREVSLYTVIAAALYTLFSGMEYIWANRLFIRSAL